MLIFCLRAALGAAAVLTPLSGAFAHATLETASAKAGTTHKAVMRVPHGCDGSPTTTVKITVPNGVVSVKPMPKPGWTLETVKGDYDKPVQDAGKTISSGVKEIIWSGGRLLDEHYDEFVFRGRLADTLPANAAIHFATTQLCEKGEVAWTQIPAPGQDAHGLKLPAPSLLIMASDQAAKSQPSAVLKIGTLEIDTIWARGTPPGAKVGGGFMRIRNTGKESDRLIGFSSPLAKRGEVHEMAVNNGVMMMREIKGLEIKPGEAVELKPGGYHVMFMDLTGPLKAGEPVKGTLTFEKAGQIEVLFPVSQPGATSLDGKAAASPSGHSHH
jgi:periplasmic copper chaperone A